MAGHSGIARNLPAYQKTKTRRRLLDMTFRPTEDQRRTVEKLSGLGLPQSDIAAGIGVDDKTLRKHFRAELDMGAAKANSEVAEFLFNAASGKRGEGSAAITTAIFWAKTRMRWKEVSVT